MDGEGFTVNLKTGELGYLSADLGTTQYEFGMPSAGGGSGGSDNDKNGDNNDNNSGDNKGFIRPASQELSDHNMVDAFVVNVSFIAAKIIGLDAIDNFVADVKSGKMTKQGYMEAMIDLGLSSASMEGVEIGGGTHTVYQGVDAEGTVRYVGITGNEPQNRFNQHLNSKGTGKESLIYNPVKEGTGLSKTQARVMEQNLINQYGLQKNGGLLLNKINSIAPQYWWLYRITK